MNSSDRIISPETLALKLAQVDNFNAPLMREQLAADPRLVELLWFIQAMSVRPGGLRKFAEDFVGSFPDRIGTPAMQKLKARRGRYSTVERIKICSEIPGSSRKKIQGSAEWIIENFGIDTEWRKSLPKLESSLESTDLDKFCREEAIANIPYTLARICNEADTVFCDQWYLGGSFVGSLLEFMDLFKQRALKALAMTEVALKVFDGLDYAWSEQVMVRIEGDTRFGKTECIKTWCAANPGKARLVSTPCTNADVDLFKAIAEALGIEFSYKTPARQIKEKVEYVIRHGRLMIVFDEAHFLLPARYTANTPPMRLNWVRTQIVDRKRAAALVSTPQEYRHCVSKFVKATGHNIQQFLGRNMLNVILPNELDEADLIAVAKVHFPDLDPDYLELIAAKAMQSESYLMAVEAIAKRARFIAKRDGHAVITIDDLNLAISEIMPAPAPTPARESAPKRIAATPRETAPAGVAVSTPRRGITPEARSREVVPPALIEA